MSKRHARVFCALCGRRILFSGPGAVSQTTYQDEHGVMHTAHWECVQRVARTGKGNGV